MGLNGFFQQILGGLHQSWGIHQNHLGGALGVNAGDAKTGHVGFVADGRQLNPQNSIQQTGFSRIGNPQKQDHPALGWAGRGGGLWVLFWFVGHDNCLRACSAARCSACFFEDPVATTSSLRPCMVTLTVKWG